MLDLTVLILTYNEKENIGRTLDALRWAPRILVLDSYSTDETVAICQTFSTVAIAQRAFTSFAEQCNWGLSQIQTKWVLSLDADYIITDGLSAEIRSLSPAKEPSGYSARFKYCIHGVAVRNTVLPPRTILYRRSAATYHDEGHGHRVKVEGEVTQLTGYILHDDRKPFSRWLRSQDQYMTVEAPHLLGTPNEELNLQDRLRKKIFFAPPVMFLYLLFVRGLILDGWPGWYYVAQRTIAELILSLRLLTEREKIEKQAGGSEDLAK